jgi:excisionase family DNA binding protein
MGEPWMRVRTVAAQLDVSVQTVRGWLRTGQLAGVRLGGTKSGWRIARTDLERFIENRRRVHAS